jgi:predicted nucleic acid-binding protein
VKYLLDTNVISELRKRGRAHPNVLRWVGGVDVVELGTSVVVLGELRRGIELKRLKDRDQAALMDHWFVKMRDGLKDRVTPIDEPIADAWARINVPNPLPFVDGLLAATALTRGLVLVTRNTRDMAASGVQILDPFLDPKAPSA